MHGAKLMNELTTEWRLGLFVVFSISSCLLCDVQRKEDCYMFLGNVCSQSLERGKAWMKMLRVLLTAPCGHWEVGIQRCLSSHFWVDLVLSTFSVSNLSQRDTGLFTLAEPPQLLLISSATWELWWSRPFTQPCGRTSVTCEEKGWFSQGFCLLNTTTVCRREGPMTSTRSSLFPSWKTLQIPTQIVLVGVPQAFLSTTSSCLSFRSC